MEVFQFKRFCVGLLFLLQGCLTPINMAYDNAIPLEKKEFSISAAYSSSQESVESNARKSLVADNYMLRLGYGIHENITLYSGLYQKRNDSNGDGDLFVLLTEKFNTYNHYDFGAKFSLNKKKTLATKAMGGLYSLKGDDFAYSIYNSIIWTKEFNQYIELSVILHNTSMIYGTSIDPYPGFNINAGFSMDRSKWVVRTEFGTNTEATTLGIGAEVKFGKKN